MCDTMKKQWTSREFAQLLRKNGYECVRSNGDHKIYKGNGYTVSVNVHLNSMVAKRLIKECSLKVMQKIKLLFDQEARYVWNCIFDL